MGKTPEAIATTKFRDRLKSTDDAFTIKLSDTYTRGVPDLLVVITRVVMVEMKIAKRVYAGSEVYSALGLSGIQDERLRSIASRSGNGACAVTVRDGEYELWIPGVRPDYLRAASGYAEVVRWLRS